MRGPILTTLGGAAALLFLLLQPYEILRENTAHARGAAEPFWQAGEPGPAGGRPDSVADLAEALSPAVVNIQTERKASGARGRQEDLFEEFFGRPFPRRERPRRGFRTESTGSGFVISRQGHIVTNNHVIHGADRIWVVFEDGRKLEAQVVGTDPKTDLALIEIDSDLPLEVAPLGDSDRTRVGDWVMAIGNPFGLDHSVTLGILSARGRDIDAGPYDDFLQTDASINPGNSGGPLIDMKGRVIGINTAINAHGQGIGFAIPINMAKQLLPALREHGSVTRGWLGVSIQRVNPVLAEAWGLDEARGALISQVFDDGPAAKAKLQRGDVIVEFDGVEVEEFDDLPRIVAATAPGAKVGVVVLRDGERKKLNAVLDTLAEEPILVARREAIDSEWGFSVERLTPETAARLELPEDTRGVVVSDVDPDSNAARVGLRPGDLVLEVNRKEVSRPSQVEEALEQDDERAVLVIQRGEGTLYLAIEK